MMTEDLHQLAGPYALDALDDTERAAFERHLESCSSCMEEVADYLAVATDLAGATSVAPPAGLRDAVLAEVAQTRQVPPIVPERVVDLAERRRRRLPRPRLLAAVAAAIVVVAGIAGAARLTATDPVEVVLGADDAVALDLGVSAADPVAAGIADAALTVTWSPERGQAVIEGAGLADLDDDEVYELWYVLSDGVARAALFSPDAGSVRTAVDLDPVDGTPIGWGITIEPAGGSEQPTGEVLLVATV